MVQPLPLWLFKARLDRQLIKLATVDLTHGAGRTTTLCHFQLIQEHRAMKMRVAQNWKKWILLGFLPYDG